MIRIGTRGSELALKQAHWVADELSSRGLMAEILIIKTKGDLVQDRFDKIEGKGFFTKEIEDALLANEIDLAVHCLKDLPTAETEGLKIAAIPARENPYDVLIAKRMIAFSVAGYPELDELTIATSSNRRVYGLKSHSPKAQFIPIRGNVPTRIRKMAEGQADAVVLARAGLNRLQLDLSQYFMQELGPHVLVPAPGQGALALQTRVDAAFDLGLFHCENTARCTAGERFVLAGLQGGCQLPLGVLIDKNPEGFVLRLFLGLGDERPPVWLEKWGKDPMVLAQQALEEVLPHRP